MVRILPYILLVIFILFSSVFNLIDFTELYLDKVSVDEEVLPSFVYTSVIAILTNTLFPSHIVFFR